MTLPDFSEPTAEKCLEEFKANSLEKIISHPSIALVPEDKRRKLCTDFAAAYFEKLHDLATFKVEENEQIQGRQLKRIMDHKSTVAMYEWNCTAAAFYYRMTRSCDFIHQYQKPAPEAGYHMINVKTEETLDIDHNTAIGLMGALIRQVMDIGAKHYQRAIPTLNDDIKSLRERS